MKRLFFLLLALLLCTAIPAIAEIGKRIEGDGYYLENVAADQWQLYDESGAQLVDYFWCDDELNYMFQHNPDQDASLPFYGFQENGLGIIRMGLADSPIFGCINRDGQFVIGPSYELICDFKHGAARVLRDGKWGLIHESGAIMLPTKYDEITIYQNPSCTATLGDQTYDYILYDDQAVPPTVDAGTIDMDAYLPHTGTQTPALDEAAALQLTDDLPRLDGATALLPLYCGLAQAVYPDDVRFERTEEAANPIVTFTNTPGSYFRLIHGQCDLIFVAQPSDEQLADAAEMGVELELTPIATEAFVFFVNGNNPLEGLTIEQIREIYSGQITQWSDLGVDGLGEIVAYQRPKNSGSQTALEKLMGDVPLMEPPSEVELDSFGMDDIVNVIEYRNTPDALGYSFRFYLTTMMDSDVNLLALDSVEPSEETIADGTYPIIAQIYAVSRKGEANPNVQTVIDWLRSEQGKELIRRSGYVPVP